MRGRNENFYRWWSALYVREDAAVVASTVNNLVFVAFYALAITVLALHFTGALAARGLEWLVHVIAVLVFPVVLVL